MKYCIFRTWCHWTHSKINGGQTSMNQSDDTWHKATQGISSSFVSLSLKLNTACTDLKLDLLKSRLTWTRQLSEHMFWARPKICAFWQSISQTSSQVMGAKRLLFNVSFLFSPGKEADLIAMETYGQWVGEIMHHIKLEKIRCTIGVGSLGNVYNTWQYILMTM